MMAPRAYLKGEGREGCESDAFVCDAREPLHAPSLPTHTHSRWRGRLAWRPDGPAPSAGRVMAGAGGGSTPRQKQNRWSARPSQPRLGFGMPRGVIVYTGAGAGARSAASAAAVLAASLPGAVVTTQASPSALAASDWHASTAAIILPGGADSPYARDLEGCPNASLRAFVEGGGAYVGLCAGAYYGCASIEFEPSNPRLKVAGPRHLSFFNGVALGAAVPGFEYESEAGAAAVTLAWRRHTGSDRSWRPATDYCNGGPVFVGADGVSPLPDDDSAAGVTVIARYAGGVPDTRPATPAVTAARSGGAAAPRLHRGRGRGRAVRHPPRVKARRTVAGWRDRPVARAGRVRGQARVLGGGVRCRGSGRVERVNLFYIVCDPERLRASVFAGRCGGERQESERKTKDLCTSRSSFSHSPRFSHPLTSPWPTAPPSAVAPASN